ARIVKYADGSRADSGSSPKKCKNYRHRKKRETPWIGPSEPEHVIQAERAVFREQSVIAEQAAGRAAHHDVGTGTGAGPLGRIERVAVAPQMRAAARDADLPLGDLCAV